MNVATFFKFGGHKNLKKGFWALDCMWSGNRYVDWIWCGSASTPSSWIKFYWAI